MNLDPSNPRVLKAAKRLLKVQQARSSLVDFAQLTMPTPDEPDNPDKSRYDPQYFHRALAKALEEVEAGRLKRLIITFPPRHGKQFADTTPVLTPRGWTTHGALRPGDEVFGPDGKPTRVVAVSGPSLSCLEIEFTDGSKLKTHPDHEWTVFGRGAIGGWVTLETRELQRRKLMSGKTKPRATYQLPLRPCVEFAAAKLPTPPYVLGAWLGDGSTGKACITHAPQETEVVSAIADYGYAVSAVWTHATTGVLTTAFSGGALAQDLRDTGVFHDKHIPHVYKFSSVEQRLQLLAGLTDTDGHVEEKTGRVRIATVSERLADDICEVVRSLGWHPCKYEQGPALSTSGIQGTKPVFYVGFQPDRPLPTHLPRKRIARLASRRRVGIKAIRPCAPEVGRCIQVDREDGLYLVGRELIVTHNSELTSKRFPAWFAGRNPQKSFIFGTYNQDFAEDFGRAVREIINSDAFAQVFPEVGLKPGSQASNRLETTSDGLLVFAGRGGSITGRGGHLIVIDDPLKNREEADSENIRNELWQWFNDDVYTRLMDQESCVIIIQTRWHEDDLVGRLTDPKNPHYTEDEAKLWKIINIPALAEENDVLGRAPGEALWPAKFGVDHLMSIKRRNPRGFTALYQQRPTPEDGDFFKSDQILTYLPHELPPKHKLKFYMASDHAVGQKQENDKTCIVIVAVDENDYVYVVDCWWKKAKTDEVVEKLIDFYLQYKPLKWWAEEDHIVKSIGPFLKLRMRARQAYFAFSKVNAYADKQKKAQAIQGRMAWKTVLFPKHAAWFQDAKDELLKFPRAAHDDFVDALSTFGRGLGVIAGPPKERPEDTGPREGTWAWLKQSAGDQRRAQKIRLLQESM